MNLRNTMVIICILLMAVLCFIEYLKDKKVYRLLAIIATFIVIYMFTPFASNISKTFENALLGIVVILSISICYLLIRDEKNNKK